MQCQNASAIDTSHCRAVRRSWASIYDVHSELGPQEADEKYKISGFVKVTRGDTPL